MTVKLLQLYLLGKFAIWSVVAILIIAWAVMWVWLSIPKHKKKKGNKANGNQDM